MLKTKLHFPGTKIYFLASIAESHRNALQTRFEREIDVGFLDRTCEEYLREKCCKGHRHIIVILCDLDMMGSVVLFVRIYHPSHLFLVDLKQHSAIPRKRVADALPI